MTTRTQKHSDVIENVTSILKAKYGFSKDTAVRAEKMFGKEWRSSFGSWLKRIVINKSIDTIKNSKVLTGNHLGMLGNIEALPSKNDVDKFGKEHPYYFGIDSVKRHTFAKEFLVKKDILSAWKVLLIQ